MAHYEPTAAAREVAAAHRALGPYLAAVEIGNEPNAYGSHGFRQLPWIAQGYEEQVSEYREAIAALTPGCRSPVPMCPARASSENGARRRRSRRSPRF